MAYLDGAFVSKQIIHMEKYKQIMENKFLVELNSSMQYNKLQNFKGFLMWFECNVSNVVTNLLQWCGLLSIKRQGALDHNVGKLMWSKFHGGPNSRRCFLKKVRLPPWMGETVRNLFAQIGSYGVLWIPSIHYVLVVNPLCLIV